MYLERWNVICGILFTHQIPPVSVNITVGPNFLKFPQKREYNIIFTDENITETIFKKNVRFPFYKSFLAIFGKKNRLLDPKVHIDTPTKWFLLRTRVA